MSFSLTCAAARADCFEQAAVRYDVPAELLRAVAWVESGTLDAAKAENRNSNGTRDIGRMQINSAHLPQLSNFGITEQSLREECTSIHVGAWLLAHGIQRFGLTWEAVGSYNVGCRALTTQECTRRRNTYAWKVARALEREPVRKAPTASAPKAATPPRALAAAAPSGSQRSQLLTKVAEVQFDE